MNILTSVYSGAARGASAVAASLAHNTSLEVLHITCDPKGAISIAKTLTTNKALKKLFLYCLRTYMYLNEKAVIEVIKSLHKNNTLSELGIPPPDYYVYKDEIQKAIKDVNDLRSPGQKVVLLTNTKTFSWLPTVPKIKLIRGYYGNHTFQHT